MSAFRFSANIPVKHNITAGDVRFTFLAEGEIISLLLPLPADSVTAQNFLRVAGAKSHLVSCCTVVPQRLRYICYTQTYSCQKSFFRRRLFSAKLKNHLSENCIGQVICFLVIHCQNSFICLDISFFSLSSSAMNFPVPGIFTDL